MHDVNQILEERGSTHGSFLENAKIMQELKHDLRDTINWHRLPSYMQEALEMIAHKMGRITTGNAFHCDHWDDIAGYATLVANELRAKDDSRSQNGVHKNPTDQEADTPRPRPRTLRQRPVRRGRTSSSMGG